MELSLSTRKIIFIAAALCCLLPFMSPPLALLLGLIIAQLMEHPFLHLNHQATSWLLKLAVIGLGFGMNLASALKAGKEGFLFTVVSIFGVLILGFILGKVFKTERKTSFLISSGTAICGGSAIAALSPVMKAGEKEISAALGIVFILNSVALFVFPGIGHAFNLSQSQFGLWCAIAIHDTSSVVGAASKYGEQALQIATTVKLARALWIVPVAFFTAFLFKSDQNKIKVPYFIGLFILAILANTYLPFIKTVSPYLVDLAKTGLTLTLFLIGSGLSFKVIKSVGIKPFFQGVLLWIAICSASLWAIMIFA
ncbi:YeiH family protein [Pedobacter cryoconitis]|uniref:Putative integral membrane protein (TIGR00698 family) n=1 Tax=Pedobacter cryoconitis TaxID=188932 RepID=A0A7X0MM39_9SPHI|nr:putative sulfate exporter family transporter [Pedobacter cryoconitis]MBB6502068.1 putative integral membrane protein (TIGR00698 family) [Pedobacter cryoconitis]